MMNTEHHEVSEEVLDSNIVVEYEDDMETLMHTSGTYKYDDEEDHSDGDEYGGMPHEMYNNIVQFLKNGTYPNTLNSQLDRSALSHWRSKCSRFTMAQDSETLLYCNPTSSVSDAAKIVVKKGEVRSVIERIHTLIGHLGQKRTQMAVLKKLHWRSVRQDVKNFIVNCHFCHQKKLDGKKITKAPVDISSDNFGFNIEARIGDDVPLGERLIISLVGYDEHAVQTAALSRMTSYTFKETTNDLRDGRTIKPELLAPGTSTSFRRQPYIRRSRFTPFSHSYMLPYTPKGPKEEPEFIIYNPSRPDAGYIQDDEYELDEGIVEENRRISDNINDRLVHCNEGSTQITSSIKQDDHNIVYVSHPQKRMTTNRISTLKSMKQVRGTRSNPGIAGRYSNIVGERIDISQNSADLLTSLDAVQNRAELVGLAPIMMLPSVDNEVITLQKELLTRQLHIQELQAKLLQSHLDSVRIPIARYEEIDPQGERIQLIDDNGESVMEELNVMDNEEEDEMTVMKPYEQ